MSEHRKPVLASVAMAVLLLLLQVVPAHAAKPKTIGTTIPTEKIFTTSSSRPSPCLAHDGTGNAGSPRPRPSRRLC